MKSGEAGDIALPDLLRLLLRRRRVIANFVIISLVAGVMYCLLTARKFEAVAFLTMDPEGTNSLDLNNSVSGEESNGLGFDEQLETQARILQSNSLAWTVISDLQLNNKPGFSEHSRLAFMEPHKPSANAFSEKQLTAGPNNRLLDQFKNALTVRVIPRTQGLELRFRNEDPVLAADILNRLVTAYRTRVFQTRFDDTLKSSGWLSNQLDDLKRTVDKSQSTLSNFQKTTGIFGANENDNLVLTRLDDLSKELTDAEANRILDEAQLRLAQSGNPELIGTIVPDSVLPVLRAQQADLQNQLAKSTAEFGSHYPPLMQLQNQLMEVNKSLKKETAEILERFRAKYQVSEEAEKQFRVALEHQKQLAGDMSGGLDQYGILKREVESGNELYEDLQKKQKEAGIVASLEAPTVDVVDPATVPTDPIEPKKGLALIISLGIGAASGVVFALIWSTIDPTIQSADEVFTLTALPILGFFYRCRSSKSKPVDTNADFGQRRSSKHPGLSWVQSYPTAANEIQSLISRLLVSTEINNSKIVLISSAVQGEGKTTISIHLAANLSQNGARVLLIDSARKGDGICQALGLASTGGLYGALSQSADWHDQLLISPAIPGLHILPSGRSMSNSSELLRSKQMETIVNEWRSEYAHIIFDSSPTLLAPDPLLLARWADNIILVSRLGITPRKGFRRTYELLYAANPSILGCVINAISRADGWFEFGFFSPQSSRSTAPAKVQG